MSALRVNPRVAIDDHQSDVSNVKARAGIPPGGDASPPDLRLITRIGYGAIALQFLAMLLWSHVLYQHFALTFDYAQYHQAWYLIAHGDLNPYDSVHGFAFVANDSEFILWPLALLAHLPGGDQLFLALQDLAVALAGLLAFRWVRSVVAEQRWPAAIFNPIAAMGLALVLLLFNPWVYWSISNDWHVEEFGTLFLVLCAYSLYRMRWRSFALWAFLVLLCGLPMAAALAGVGLGAVLAGRRYRWAGAMLAVTALVWLGVASALGGGAGGASGASLVGYLAATRSGSATLRQVVTAVVAHPLRVLTAWWKERIDGFAMVAGSGLIGVVSPWGFGVALVVLLETGLVGTASYRPFAAIAFQNLPLFALVSVGTVLALGSLARRLQRRRVIIAICLLLMAYMVAWFATWVPQLPSTWIRIDNGAVSELNAAEHLVPQSAELVVSQGVAGRFSDRRWLYTYLQPTTMPVHTPDVYFLVTPYAGIEVASVQEQLSLISELAGPLHATLLLHGAGIWLFRWEPSAGTTSVVLRSASPTVPAWALRGPAAQPVLSGPEDTWHMVSNGQSGYVVDGAYFRAGKGTFRVTATLATTAPVNVEVWNATGNVLLARRSIPATNGQEAVQLTVEEPVIYPRPLFRGTVITPLVPLPGPPTDDLEVRIYTQADNDVSVYSISFVRIAVGSAGRT
jgi:uncharacterized membrane protein